MSQDPRPRIPTPFTAETTADEVLEEVDLAGRRTLITGATSGPGLEAAVALARAGADVTIAVRDLGRGCETARWIRHRSHGATVKVTSLDLGDLGSVRALVTQWDGPLDILINAAQTGVTATRQRTPDGLEHQFGINYFGHFALTREFRHRLQQSGNARVVTVSAPEHQRAPFDLDDLTNDVAPYDPIIAHARSRTAAALLAVALTDNWSGDHIIANTVHTGGLRQNLTRRTMPDYLDTLRERHGSLARAPWSTSMQAASTIVLAAASPLLDRISGRYWENNEEAEIVAGPTAGRSGVAPHALDRVDAGILWERSTEILHRLT